MSQISLTVENFPKDKKYALVVKFDIAQSFRKIDVMKSTIRELEK